MEATRRVNTKRDNRALFPEISPFVDALNAALAAHGSAPAKVSYLYRPGVELGRKDSREWVPFTFFDGKPANGSELVKQGSKHKR